MLGYQAEDVRGQKIPLIHHDPAPTARPTPVKDLADLTDPFLVGKRMPGEPDEVLWR